ncbi:hypothetical protein IHE43_04505 [Flavobacterium sp. MDT1-60]|nr:STM3941 family protein [Flavobacterium sp. MDT1-60]QOG04879.1 hypothetical protein IHE43_04505 [Flavobacterium sp. MDT1-60]
MGSLLFVIGGIWMFMDAENLASHRRSPIFLKGIGIISVLFFGIGIYVSIKQLTQDQLLLVIDGKGINVNPRKPTSKSINWENIDGFSELKIQSQKLVIVQVNNSDYWIENENNQIRKKLMKFNFNNYGSPFNLSANSMQINYVELMRVLNDNLNKYKHLT